MGHLVGVRVEILSERFLEAELLVATDQKVDESVKERVDTTEECESIFNSVSLESRIDDFIVVFNGNFHEPGSVKVF